MDQRRGIQRLARLLVRQPRRRQLPQFVIHQRQQFIGGTGVAVPQHFQ